MAQLRVPDGSVVDELRGLGDRLCAIFYCFECRTSGSASFGPGDGAGAEYPDLGGWAVVQSPGPWDDCQLVSPPARPPVEIRPAAITLRAGRFLPDLVEIRSWAGETEPSRWSGQRQRPGRSSPHRDLAREILAWCRTREPDRWWLVYRQLQRQCQSQALGDEVYFSRYLGHPSWIQLYTPHYCPVCARELALLAQLHSRPDIGLLWRADGWGCMFVFQCPEHPAEVSVLVDRDD